MARWSRRLCGWMAVSFGLCLVSSAHAEDFLPKEGTWSSGIRSGYTISLDNKGVKMVPVHVHIGYTLFKGKPWILPEGSFEIGTEPFASVITSPTVKEVDLLSFRSIPPMDIGGYGPFSNTGWR